MLGQTIYKLWNQVHEDEGQYHQRVMQMPCNQALIPRIQIIDVVLFLGSMLYHTKFSHAQP